VLVAVIRAVLKIFRTVELCPSARAKIRFGFRRRKLAALTVKKFSRAREIVKVAYVTRALVYAFFAVFSEFRRKRRRESDLWDTEAINIGTPQYFSVSVPFNRWYILHDGGVPAWLY
jgi:hypothetical protein